MVQRSLGSVTVFTDKLEIIPAMSPTIFYRNNVIQPQVLYRELCSAVEARGVECVGSSSSKCIEPKNYSVPSFEITVGRTCLGKKSCTFFLVLTTEVEQGSP